jgi:putative lipoprotein
MRVSSWRVGCVLPLVLCGLIACGSKEDGPVANGRSGEIAVAQIAGSVVYRERMMLPPGAEVEVQLQDISRADAMATVLATVVLTPEGGPPYDFSIEYDPSRIDERMRYALRATISVGDKLMFTSTDYIDPFAGNPVQVLVRRVAEPVQRADRSLAGRPWALQALGGESAGQGADGKPLTIEFEADSMRAAGFSGCNRYSGGYSRGGVTQHGSPLQLGPMAGTMMACARGGELEQAYLQMLAKVTAFRLEGDTLSLLAGADVLATFQLL